MRFSIFKKNNFSTKRAFTLIELMVVIAVVSIVTTVLVVQQNKWNDRLAVNTQIYELALMLRQAQVFSLGVKQNISTPSDPFNVGYGVCLDATITDSYVFFVDNNHDYVCGSGETLETKTLNRGVTISKICGTYNGAEVCSSDSPTNIRSLHISFFRPGSSPSSRTSSQPYVEVLNSSGSRSTNVLLPVYIYFRSPNNLLFKVRVENSGQISIL